jgi:cytochrome c
MRRNAAWLAAGLGAAMSITSARAQFAVPGPTPAPDPATLFLNQCATCHSAKQGDAPRQGPNLFGVVGRKAGTYPGFKYSAGLASADFVWDEARLDAYITNPQAMIKGAVMAYKQPNPATRKAIISWLKEQH